MLGFEKAQTFSKHNFRFFIEQRSPEALGNCRMNGYFVFAVRDLLRLGKIPPLQILVVFLFDSINIINQIVL